ncbi:MAG: TIR domain-containing protein [Polyangiaceae bacterium]|nr:TIR domain-containing protein [Polyangiaceae bacterium]
MMSDSNAHDRRLNLAFISYRTRDDDVHGWAGALRHALEYFPVTGRICRESKREKTPTHVRPIFMDRLALSIEGGLDQQIHNELKRSEHLIVVCSPSARQSKWIAREVRDFCRTGRQGNIHAYLVDGPADAGQCIPLGNLPRKLRALLDAGALDLLDARFDAQDRRWLRRRFMMCCPRARYWLSAPHIEALCQIVGILLQADYATVRREYRRWRVRRLASALGVVLLALMGVCLFVHFREALRVQQAREQYRTDIAAVESAWEAGQASLARKLLLATGASPYRGAEWRYLRHEQALCRQVFTGHIMSTVDLIEYSPNGERLLTHGGDHAAKVWESRSGKRLVALKPTSGYLVDACFLSDDGVVTVDEQGHLETWKIPSGKRMDAADSGVLDITRIACAPGGGTLALGDKAGHVWLKETKGQATRLSYVHQGPIRDLAFSGDGAVLATAAADDTVVVWWTSSRAVIRMLTHPSFVKAVKLSRDGGRLFTSADDGKARVWNLLQPGEPREIRVEPPARSIALSPQGNWAMTGDADNAVRVWNSETGVLLLTLRGHAKPVTAVAAAPDGQSMASGDAQGELRVWRLAPDDLPNAMPEISLAVSNDSKMYFFGNSGEVRGLPRHELLLKIPPANRPARRGAFSRDQTHLLVTDEEGLVTVWSLSTGKPEGEFVLPDAQQVQAAYLPNDPAFVICTRQGVELRDAASHSIIRTLASGGGLEGVMAVAPDGQRVAVARGEAVEEIAVATGAVKGKRRLPVGTTTTSLTYSSDGARLVATALAPRGATVAYLFSGDAETPSLEISEPGRNLSGASFLDNGARVVTSWNRRLTIRDSETGSIMLQVPLADQYDEAPASVAQLVVSRDESRIFVTGRHCQQWFIPSAADAPDGTSEP